MTTPLLDRIAARKGARIGIVAPVGSEHDRLVATGMHECHAGCPRPDWIGDVAWMNSDD